MVAKMCDILASFFAWRRRDHRLLRVTESASEHVQRSDMVGVPSVVTRDALKALSSSVFGRHQSTLRACPGRVTRIDFNKTNTVLLCELLDPRKRVPICPWRGRLAKFLAAVFLLAGLQAIQVLHADDGHPIPGKLLNHAVDVALASNPRPALALAAGLTTPDTLADGLNLSPVVRSLGIDQKLADPNVNGELHAALPRFLVGKINPKAGPSFSKFTALEEPRAGLAEPVQQPLVGLKWNNYGLALSQTRDLQNMIEATVSAFDLGDQGTQTDCVSDVGFSRAHTERLSGLLCSDDLFNSDLQTVGPMAIRQAAAGNSPHRLGVKAAPLQPKGVDIPLGAATDFATQGFDPPPLCGGHQPQGYFDGSDHLRLLKRLNGGETLLASTPLAVQPRGEAREDGDKVLHEVGLFVLGAVNNLNLEWADGLEPSEPEARKPVLMLNQQNIIVSLGQQRMQLLALIVNATAELLDDSHDGPALRGGVFSQDIRLAGERGLIFATRLAAIDSAPTTSDWCIPDLSLKPNDRDIPSPCLSDDCRNLVCVGMTLCLPERNPEDFSSLGQLNATVHVCSMAQNVAEVKD